MSNKTDIDIQTLAAMSCGKDSRVYKGPRTGQIIIIDIDCLKKTRIVTHKKGCKSNGTGKSIRINILAHSVPGSTLTMQLKKDD
jgi:hypothetical protein